MPEKEITSQLRIDKNMGIVTDLLVGSVHIDMGVLAGQLPHQLKIVEDNGDSDPFPPQSLIKIFQGGLSAKLFLSLCKMLEVPEKKLADIISLSQSTLNKRKKRGYFSPTESERLYRILNLYKLAVRVFEDSPEYARKWLKQEAFGLDGEIPLEFAKSEIGAKEVEKLLIRIDEGIFA